jgi:hypothetical protein
MDWVEKEKEVPVGLYSPDRKLVQYYEDLLKPHGYWD